MECVKSVEWMTHSLSIVIWTASHASPDKEWQKETSSELFQSVLKRSATSHTSVLHKVCRIRTENGYDDREYERWEPPGESNRYPPDHKLRIVCLEGALVRDRIDIDSSTSVGGFEMGKVVEAYDRCISANGIMRYCTSRGWIIKETREQSREPDC